MVLCDENSPKGTENSSHAAVWNSKRGNDCTPSPDPKRNRFFSASESNAHDGVTESWNDDDNISTSAHDSWHASESQWEASSSSWSSAHKTEESVAEMTGIRFVVELASVEVVSASSSDSSLGPERLRIVGDCNSLGDWDPHLGIDLFWDGGCWSSIIVEVPADKEITFRLLHVEDAPDLITLHPWYAKDARWFKWDTPFWVRAPKPLEVIEVRHTPKLDGELWSWSVMPRSACTVQTHEDLFSRLARHCEGSQRIYTFDGPNGVTLDFCLYLPPGFHQSVKRWPVLVFLHAMHARLDSDINLFYESEAPPHLLLDSSGKEGWCPVILRESFVVLCPQCPRDASHMYGSGVWFYTDWYDTRAYMPEVENDLAALIEVVTQDSRMDETFVTITGTSMGGLGCLEFASRRPGLFKACVPVAAHYEFDLDALAERLTKDQELPMWFFHAFEDTLCPFERIETLVQKLQARSRAEVRFTRYNDTWSVQGHCADRVSYQVLSRSDGQPALGSELFKWILEQRQGSH